MTPIGQSTVARRAERGPARQEDAHHTAAPRFPVVQSVEHPAAGPLRITVLAGGPSTEREVSLKSGAAVAAGLRARGHDVRIADISPNDLSALDTPADLIFIALHGRFGEDGQLQRILEQRGLPYVGSGPQASALAMDKVATKARLIEAGLPTPRFDVVTPARAALLAERWHLPAVVKPIAEGSSVDTRIVRDRPALHEALSEVAGRYGWCLLEECIVGPELTVGILGDVALPPIQIVTGRAFYNYEAKYTDDTTRYLFEIDLPAAVLARIQALSVQAHQELGCRDFSRVDWMVDAETQEPYVLEVNTIPGFTDHSLLPKAAAQRGLDFAALCERIVRMALARAHADRPH